MTDNRTITRSLAPFFAGVLLLAACSGPAQPTAAPAPPSQEKKFEYRLSAPWYPSREEPEELRLDYWIQNLTEEDQALEFSDSGRVCGFIQTPEGQEILHFPETTAQVVGTETLEAGIDRTFIQHVPASALAGLEPGRYEVKAWLCGYEDMFAWAEFFVRPPGA